MNLPADTAALLREALNEAYNLADSYPCAAYRVLGESRAYKVLAETIENLLTPLPIEPDQCQPEGLFDDYLKSGDTKDLPF
jgi:hypothetical protein